MRAVFIKKHGGPEVLELGEFEDPIINNNEALIRIMYTSVNRIDLLVRNGYPGIPVKLPHILGTDVVGYIEKVNDNTNNFSPGDLVIAHPVIGCGYCEMCSRGLENMCTNWKMIGFQINGSYAEYIKVPTRSLIKLNKSGINVKELGAVPLALLVSWRSLITLGKITRDHTVFIWGGSSGVGTFSVQIAKSFGARVITVSSKEWKIKKLKSMADLVLNYNSSNLIEEVKEFTEGNGVDLVIDPIGSSLTRSLDLEIVKTGGKIIVFGVKDSDSVPINWRKIYLKHIKIVGMHTGNKWELMRALKFVESGLIKPIIHEVIDLEKTAEAHKLLESGEVFGKIVIKVD